MPKMKGSRVAALGIVLAGMLALTACGGAKVPDKYNYDDLSEYITLGEYEGLSYDKEEVSVTDAEVQDYIDSVVQSAATTEEVDSGTVESDSVVKIDYTGKIDGEEFDGGSGEDYELDLADSDFIDGFAEQIVGHEVGEEFDIEVTFPDDYSNNEELAGQDATFTVKVNAIVETVTPEYNDDFVKENTDYDTTEEYEESVKKDLLEDAEQEAESTERQAVFQQILDGSEVKEYPDTEYDDTYDNIVSTYEELAEENDMEFSDYLEENFSMTEKEFKKEAKSAAQNTVKQELVLYALADAYDIEISNSEYNDYLEQLLEDAGYTESEYEDATGTTIEEYAEDNNLFDTMLYEEVMDKVMEKSKANE